MSYAVITGASKGIGKCIAEELASRGYDLFLIARTESLLSSIAKELQEKYKVQVHFLAIDLSLENSPEKIYEWINKHNTSIAVLVNNAGYGLWGKFDDLKLQDQQAMMRVNLNTMVELTHRLLPFLRKNTPAFVMNVSSTAAYQAVATLAVYSACKSFVILFTRALRYELRNSGVSVTCLSPGPTDTNFINRAGITNPKTLKQAVKFNMKPEDVARFAVKKMFSGKKEIVPGFINRISVWMTYFVPKSLSEKIAASLYE